MTRLCKQNARNILRGTAAGLIVSAALGCSTEQDRVEVFPVSGRVLVRGQPAEGAEVAFYPTSPKLKGRKMPGPVGTTDAKGQFQLRSYEPGDGAPAGEFKVTIVWPAPPPPNASGVFNLKDRLAGRYADPQTSTLTAQVEQGGGEIPPFELQ
jgi:hypothetical protein